MLGKHVLEDLGVTELDVGTQTPWGKHVFQTGLQSPVVDPTDLRDRQVPALIFRRKTNAALREHVHSILQTVFSSPTIRHLEDAVKPSAALDPRLRESVQQVFWAPDALGGKYLNTQHLLISFLLIWKTLVLPGVSVAAPLMAIIAPFFLIKYVHGQDLSAIEYLAHVKKTLLQHVNVPTLLRAKSEEDVFGKILETLFLGLSVFMFASSLWNQIQAALHLRSIAADMRERGESVLAAVSACRSILATLQDGLSPENRFSLRHFLTEGVTCLRPFEGLTHPLAAYGFVWNDAGPLEHLLAWVGQLDVWVALGRLEGICFPRVNKTGILKVDKVYHPQLVPEKRVPNSVSLGGPRHSHALLTGPNRGGKSTFCRSIGLAILTAQTWGFAWASRMTYMPFAHIVTALRPTDALGRLSLFESEIEFARDVLAICRSSDGATTNGGVFVMMDEIFHSTNAHDGFEATRVFLDQLYDTGSGRVTSLISTHYRGLADVFKSRIQTWAVDAAEQENGQLAYTYKIVPGVSEKSSVMEILRERGLLSTPVTNAEKSPNNSKTPQQNE